MNLRSYLKGIGVGIIVAALVLIIAGKINKAAVSDDEIKRRAKELGMIESTTLSEPLGNKSSLKDYEEIPGNKEKSVSDNLSENENSSDISIDNAGISEKDSKEKDALNEESSTEAKNDTSDTNKNESDVNTSEINESDKNASDKDADKNSDKGNNESNNDKNTDMGETVRVEIISGMSSESVASAVKAAGLVSDDIEFNSYLCSNGYDKTLRVGSHEIKKGADFETIARALCGE
ncbi:MAG: hypothetical protein J5856_09790 [Lachnospiraceae bacterium]|nr:hypothetical protein [Lachnospiraceae bacterium]